MFFFSVHCRHSIRSALDFSRFLLPRGNEFTRIQCVRTSEANRTETRKKWKNKCHYNNDCCTHQIDSAKNCRNRICSTRLHSDLTGHFVFDLIWPRLDVFIFIHVFPFFLNRDHLNIDLDIVPNDHWAVCVRNILREVNWNTIIFDTNSTRERQGNVKKMQKGNALTMMKRLLFENTLVTAR